MGNKMGKMSNLKRNKNLQKEPRAKQQIHKVPDKTLDIVEDGGRFQAEDSSDKGGDFMNENINIVVDGGRFQAEEPGDKDGDFMNENVNIVEDGGRFQAEEPGDKDGDFIMIMENGFYYDNTNPTFDCEICAECKLLSDSFNPIGCSHFFCVQCTVSYIVSKLDENNTRIPCPLPGCEGVLDPESCRCILPVDVFDKWGVALCEFGIDGSKKFYCPFKNCSSLLIDDGGEMITQAQCPNCSRLFCAQCKASWHDKMKCKQFQELNKDEREKEDIMLMNLAKDEHWRRCPNCRIYVERTEGCKYMICRCKTTFCYTCGGTDLDKKTHYCRACKAIWDEKKKARAG